MVYRNFYFGTVLLVYNVHISTFRHMASLVLLGNTAGMVMLERSRFKDRNFALQKQELSGCTFYIMDQKTLDPPTNISGRINLVISRSEYNGIAIPTNIDASIHTPLLSFESFDMEADNNDVLFRKAELSNALFAIFMVGLLWGCLLFIL